MLLVPVPIPVPALSPTAVLSAPVVELIAFAPTTTAVLGVLLRHATSPITTDCAIPDPLPFAAALPIITLFSLNPDILAATPEPMQTLLLPLVLAAALPPIAILLLEPVGESNALLPIAIFSFPVALFVNASSPIPILLSPVVMLAPAFSPKKEFLVPLGKGASSLIVFVEPTAYKGNDPSLA